MDPVEEVQVTVHDSDDEAYFKWLAEHPDGFVLNTKRLATDGACSIHRATCAHILAVRNTASVGGFTQRGGIKLCSASIGALIAHTTSVKSVPLIEIRRCKRCEATTANIVVERRAEEFLPTEASGVVAVLVNGYERDALAIAQCLEHHGLRCKVCDVDLEQRYGVLAAGAMQVHFQPAVARSGVRGTCDPIADLLPVCPNCHMMLHRGRDTPLRVEDLRRIMERKRLRSIVLEHYRSVD